MCLCEGKVRKKGRGSQEKGGNSSSGGQEQETTSESQSSKTRRHSWLIDQHLDSWQTGSECEETAKRERERERREAGRKGESEG